MPGTYSQILLHVTFSTKGRQPLITPNIQPRLYEYMGGVVRGEGGVLHEIGGIADHVHMLLGWNTDDAIKNLMRSIKANSSKWIHQNFASHRRFYWQEGYGVFSVSKSQMATVRRYIQKQEQHHQSESFKEEFIHLLNLHEVEYDEEYLWD